MPAVFEQPTEPRQGESFFIGIFQDILEQSHWHYHNNYEISFITEGTGRRIVADSIEDFQPGDLVFIGSNLPHVWIADRERPDMSTRTLETVFLQFTADILSPMQLALPEFHNVARALQLAESGMRIEGQTVNDVSRWMLQMPYMNGFERMVHFYMVMDAIGRCEDFKPLASREYMSLRFMPGNKRIATIHRYLMNNYREQIDLGRLAAEVNMAEGSLCRFFKASTGMTIFEFLNRIKTDFACRLLMDPELSIMEVCLDSGYNNLSHFNKQFRRIRGQTPSEFRRKFCGLF
ncbi:AraC family transcriptional regulator [Bacteroidia bacterium]|nr:AraC family transcriptional regulator [Bacteroidia bacterium]